MRSLGEAFNDLNKLARYYLPGWLLVRNRFVSELESWGIPEPAANWITWHLPYRYVNLIVRMVRHDK